MSTIERPGINSKWLKRMKTWHRGSMAGWWDTFNQGMTNDFEYYVEHGLAPRRPSYREIAPGRFEKCKPGETQTHMTWVTTVAGDLPLYILLRLFEYERLGTTGGSMNTALPGQIFSAFRLGEMIRFHLNDRLQIDGTPFVALGIILGCKKDGFELARLRIAYFRQLLKRVVTEDDYDVDDVINTKKNWPIFHFMMRILADYLNEAPHLLVGEGVDEPIFQSLLKLWRDPDPQALVPACLAACDFHTHRCWDENHEFPLSHWVYIPIEILLLFKLRQLLGLQNPTLDHPIMNSPLGVLPEEVRCEPDDLIRRVRERMIQDGYDEAKILARYETNVDARMPKT